MTTATAEPIETEFHEKLRYPVGKFGWGKEYSEEDIQKLIKKIDEFPARLSKLATGLTQEQLNATYREGGWTVRQLIHHIFDSHMNAYTRFKLALTEEMPAIKPYNEKLWAELEDAKTSDPAISLNLISNLHKRWVILLRSMTSENFERGFFHPEHNHVFQLKEILAMYVWHGDHHYAHIQLAKGSKNTAKAKSAKPVVAKKAAKKQSAK